MLLCHADLSFTLYNVVTWCTVSTTTYTTLRSGSIILYTIAITIFLIYYYYGIRDWTYGKHIITSLHMYPYCTLLLFFNCDLIHNISVLSNKATIKLYALSVITDASSAATIVRCAVTATQMIQTLGL